MSKDCIHSLFEDFVCRECKRRAYLQNGMLIMGKFEKEWWPGKIIPPPERPSNIKPKEPANGEFLVFYYGIGRYCWAHAGCVYPYEAMEIEYPKNIQRMLGNKTPEVIAELYGQHLIDESISNIKHTYSSIRDNITIPPVVYGHRTMADNCNCDKADPCTGFSCLNRATSTECPGRCQNGEDCRNQKFKNREYAKTKVIYSKYKGLGLAAAEEIEEDAFVIEYVGEVITLQEYHERYEKLQKDKYSKYYFLEIDSKRFIDAGPKGNSSRFINHSCQPNCTMKKWSADGDEHIGIFSIKKIAAGEELFFNYNYKYVAAVEQCFCGAENCKGYIGYDTWKEGFSKQPKVKVLKMNLKNDIYSLKDCSHETYVDEHNQVQNAIYVSKKLNIAVLPAKEKKFELFTEHDDAPSGTDARKSIEKNDSTENNSGMCIENGVTADAMMDVENNVLIEDDSRMDILNGFSTQKEEKMLLQNGDSAEIHETGSIFMDCLELDTSDFLHMELAVDEEKLCSLCAKPATVMCNREGCARLFDDGCAQLGGSPEGEWICTKHRCVICGEETCISCVTCPTSFCARCWADEIPEYFQCEICRIRYRTSIP